MQLDTKETRYFEKNKIPKKVWDYLNYNTCMPDYYLADIWSYIDKLPAEQIIEKIKHFEKINYLLEYGPDHPEADKNHPRKLWGRRKETET